MPTENYTEMPEVEQEMLNIFGTIPIQQKDGSYKIHTSEVNKEQIVAMSVMDSDIKIKRSGKGMSVIVKSWN